MKYCVVVAIIVQLVSGCSGDKIDYGYDYVKITTLRDIDSGNAYNKGKGIWAYLYYNPNTDSVVFRKGHLVTEDSAEFTTYEGKFENRHYADTVSMLIDLLKRHKGEELYYKPYDSTYGVYCGPDFSVEYNIHGHSNFISFIVESDTLQMFENFLRRLSRVPWDKKLVPNSRIDETEETVHMLQGLGTYDSIVYTPPYIPLPCEKGIKIELLYGQWKTIGDKYNNANLMYWTTIIGKDGSWVMERFYDGEMHPRYSGKIVSISGDYVIKLNGIKKEDGIATFKVLNLTENCLEYKSEGSNHTWRLDRMK